MEFDPLNGVVISASKSLGIHQNYIQERGKWGMNITIHLNDLQEGYYLLTITIEDAVGNTYKLENSPVFAIDTSAPTIAQIKLYSGKPDVIVENTTGEVTEKTWNTTVELKENQEYNAYLEWDNEQTDLDIYIYDPNGYLTAISQNAGYTPENITFKTIIGGTYKVVILRYSGPETQFKLTIREVNNREEIRGIGSKTSFVTIEAVIKEVNLKQVNIQINGEEIAQLTMKNAVIAKHGICKFQIAINTTRFSGQENTVKITAVDVSNREGVKQEIIIKDTNNPRGSIEVQKYVRETMKLNVTYFDNETGIKSAKIIIDEKLVFEAENGQMALNITGLVDGQHKIKLVLVDNALNEYNKTEYFYYDTTPPLVAIYGLNNNTEIGVNSIVLIELVDNIQPSAIRLYLNGTISRVILATNGSGIYTTVLNLKNIGGNHVEVKLLAFDMAGNTYETTYVYAIDRHPPEVSITLPNYKLINCYNITVNITDDNLEIAFLYIDGVLYKEIHENGTTLVEICGKDFHDGEHTVELLVIDKAGNIVTKEGSFTTAYYENLVNEEKTRGIWLATGLFIVGAIAGSISLIIYEKKLKGKRK